VGPKLVTSQYWPTCTAMHLDDSLFEMHSFDLLLLFVPSCCIQGSHSVHHHHCQDIADGSVRAKRDCNARIGQAHFRVWTWKDMHNESPRAPRISVVDLFG
jgi:hypothetical protein